MLETESTAQMAFPLSAKAPFEVVDLPEENRSGVFKKVNPSGWNAAVYSLAQFKGQAVHIKFSAQVKRVGAPGDLRWNVNCRGYPTVGAEIKDAQADTWYSMSGEWTGLLVNNRVFYLSTHNNNSKITTYYIDDFSIEVTPVDKSSIPVAPAAMGERKDRPSISRSLQDMAVYLKGLLPADIPQAYALKPMFRSIAEEESVRRGVLAYRDFLYLFCDRLIADSSIYDKPPKNEDSHASIAARYPILSNAKNVLINIGYHGEPTWGGSALLLRDWKVLSATTVASGGQAALKLSVPKIVEALRFLTDCGMDFDGINLDEPKPDTAKITALTVRYPDSPAMLTGLKAMAVAQKDLDIKDNDEVFLRCDYRVLEDAQLDVTALLQDYLRPLPARVQAFALGLHRQYIDAGFTCKPKVFFLNFQFIYSYKNKEIWSFFASIVAGYRILIKAQNTHKYPDTIKTFPLSLQEEIARGYGCQRKRFDEPCQKGCHGFSFPLDDTILAISKDLGVWLEKETDSLKKK